ncbi:tyrosine-type recombinase/integrase [Deinococcus pimensis]|uniref:tyrosine-type recombinase/integrase n=1 Tax=Deinococcus pimensis TaxID=309888 RepID=UPI0004853EB4|nr:tyrosine-type recombinase/integrase [Deinococcus pimensis]
MSVRLFKRFLASRRALGSTPATLTWLEDAYRPFRVFSGRDPVDRSLCRAYLLHLQGSGLPPEDVRRAWRGIRVFLRWAVEQGELDERVLLPGPAAQVRFRDALTSEDIQRVVAAAQDHQTALLVWTLFTTGWRSEKVLTLTWQDVDFERHLLWTTDHEGERVSIHLPTALEGPLRDWRRSSSSGWVFSLAGNPLSSAEVRQQLRAAGEKAGLPFLAPGQLQYAFLRVYFRSGMTRSSSDLQALLAQPFRVRGFHIPNLVTQDELRAAHAAASPFEHALRSSPSKPRPPRRKP